MIDLEEHLRDEFRREAQSLQPSPDLADRIMAGIGRHEQHRVVAAAAATVGVVGLVAGGLLALRGDGDDHESIVIDTPHETATTHQPSTTTTSGLPTTTTIPPEQTTTTTPDEYNATGPLIWDEMPLERHGVGPVYAGDMRIIDAEIAGHVGIGVDPQVWEAFGRSCAVFTMATEKMKFVAWTPGHEPTDDSQQAVIRAIGGSDPAIHTAEGIHPGSSSADVYAAYGQPTRTTGPFAAGDTEDILIYEDAYGYAYGFLIADDVVVDVRSGLITGWEVFQPCQ